MTDLSLARRPRATPGTAPAPAPSGPVGPAPAPVGPMDRLTAMIPAQIRPLLPVLMILGAGYLAFRLGRGRKRR